MIIIIFANLSIDNMRFIIFFAMSSHDNSEAKIVDYVYHIFLKLNFGMNLLRLWDDVRDVVTCMGVITQR